MPTVINGWEIEVMLLRWNAHYSEILAPLRKFHRADDSFFFFFVVFFETTDLKYAWNLH